MKTPKEFIDNVKNKTITEEMLEVCLYSVNKGLKIAEINYDNIENVDILMHFMKNNMKRNLMSIIR